MWRSPVLAALLYLPPGLAQTPAPGPGRPEPELIQVQSLLDSGKLSEAEAGARRFLETHAASADAHYLLAYILFRESNPKLSLAEFSAGARLRSPSVQDLEVAGGDSMLLEDYAGADGWFTRAVEADPREALARYYLGRAKFNEKHFEEAIRAFTECLRLDPKNVKAADNLGLAYEAMGKTDEALEAYRTAIASEAGMSNPEPYLNLGTLLVESGQPAEAVPYLVQAKQGMPSDSRAHRELGKAYLQLNRLAEAQVELEAASSIAPENAPTHFLLAQVYRKQGQTDRERIENQRYAALTGAHSSPETPLQEARSLLEQNKLPEAERVARRYLDVHKNSAEGHYLIGYILFKRQDPKASLAEYTEGAKYRRPTAAELETVAGDYVLLKDYPDADKWFTMALERNPGDALGWYYLGRTKYNENRFQEAVDAFRRCLTLDPKNVKAEDNLGLAYEGLNQIDDAAAAYRTAIAWQVQADSTAKDPGPMLDLGSLLVDNDRAAEGLPYLIKAEKISARDYRVHRQLGKAYMHLGQLDQARAQLERAVQLAPENAPIHFMLARVYRSLGRMEQAKAETELYSRLAESNPADK